MFGVTFHSCSTHYWSCVCHYKQSLSLVRYTRVQFNVNGHWVRLWAFFFKAFGPRCQWVWLKKSLVGLHSFSTLSPSLLAVVSNGASFCWFSGSISQVSQQHVFLFLLYDRRQPAQPAGSALMSPKDNTEFYCTVYLQATFVPWDSCGNHLQHCSVWNVVSINKCLYLHNPVTLCPSSPLALLNRNTLIPISS